MPHLTPVTLAIWVGGGIVAGLAVYWLALRPLQRLGERRGWSTLHIGASIIGTVVVAWGGLAGLYLGLDQVAIPTRTEEFLDRVISAIAILSVTWVAARLAGSAVSSYGRQSENRILSVSLYTSIVEAAIVVIGVLTVLSSLGVAIAPLLTTLGLGGLAVALALRDTLSNLFSGVHIAAARQIRPGDYVKFDFGSEGVVTDIQWRNTTIRDAQNNLVVVPNEKVAASVFTNFSKSVSDLVVPAVAVLPWKGTFERLEAIALEAAREVVSEVAGRLQAERCTVLLTAINETNIQITAYLPVEHIDNRQRALAGFLSRLHDEALAADMGSAPGVKSDRAAAEPPAQSAARAEDPRR